MRRSAEAVAGERLAGRDLRKGRGEQGAGSSGGGEWQPGVFVIEYALAKLLGHWGVRPQSLIGYSLGEYVAACLAGVMSLEDALKLVAKRAELISEVSGGGMLAVLMSAGELGPQLDERL